MATVKVSEKTSFGFGMSGTDMLRALFKNEGPTDISQYNPAVIMKQLLDSVIKDNPDFSQGVGMNFTGNDADVAGAPKVVHFVPNTQSPGAGNTTPQFDVNKDPPEDLAMKDQSLTMLEANASGDNGSVTSPSETSPPKEVSIS